MKLQLNSVKYEIKYADKIMKRFIGLMFKKNFNYILCFPKCNGIHTFFMFTKIDVILTDKENNILYTYSNLKPWHIILPKKNVYYTYELPCGLLKEIIKTD